MVDSNGGEYVMYSKLRELIAKRQTQEGRIISNQELAALTGLNEATISRWMQPRPFKTLNVDTLVRLMDALDCSFDDLLFKKKVP